jgi:hypothetical protein
MSNHPKFDRRKFIQCSAMFASGLAIASGFPRVSLAASSKRLKVAAVITAFTYRSHAHVILENFVADYLFNGKRTSSGMDVVSLYVDQFPEGELGREFAARHKFQFTKPSPKRFV